ncbi:hypothetical protein [Burkholderia lata]|nr:hypothetical protein [Burkholderia lata]
MEIEKPPDDFFNWPSVCPAGKRIGRFDGMAGGEALAATINKR